MKKIILLSVTVFLAAFLLTSCSFLAPIPEEYLEGVKVDRNYPDDALEIYDDATVFDSDERFGEFILSCGTEDDLDDIIDFYRDFFDDKDITLQDEDEGRDEYYAKGISDGYEFEVEVEEADGKYVEDLFEYVIYLKVAESDESVSVQNNTSDENPNTVTQATTVSTPTVEPAPTQEPEETLDLPLTFKHLNYPAAAQEMAILSSLDVFKEALMGPLWMYNSTQINTNARKFEGGYNDIISLMGSNSQTVNFIDEDTFYLTDVDEVQQKAVAYHKMSVEYIQVNGTYAAVLPGDGLTTTYRDVDCQFMTIMFINPSNQLVFSNVLYDPVTQYALHLSSVNIFDAHYRRLSLYDSEFGTLEPAEFETEEAFQQAVLGTTWIHIGNVDVLRHKGNDYKPLTIALPYISVFYFSTDGNMYFKHYDTNSGELLQEGQWPYEFGNMHLYYIGAEPIVVDGIQYEYDNFFYIDTLGHLVAIGAAYNPDDDDYYFLTDANISEPYN